MRPGSKPLRVVTSPGDRLPAFCSSTGRALLARLDDEAVCALYPMPLQPPSPNAPQSVEDLLAALAVVREKGWSRATDEKSGAGFISRFLTDSLLARVQELSSVADEAGLTMAQLAVAWTLQNPNVAAAIIGASRPEQVRDNAGAAGVRLDEGLLRRIDDIMGPEIITDPANTASPPSRP